MRSSIVPVIARVFFALVGAVRRLRRPRQKPVGAVRTFAGSVVADVPAADSVVPNNLN